MQQPDGGRVSDAGAAYRHTQFGTMIALGSGIGIVLATLVVAMLSNATLRAAPWLVVALYAVFALAFALFFRLTVEVGATELRVIFGVGLLRKTVAIADIRRADIVRTRVWWGWGIHWTPSGWLYNVGGRWAVRLELATERPVMIGSDEPEALKTAIDARIGLAR